MTEVLYRKWRPRRLDQLVGQETVSQTLRQAVSLNRLAHAYLFCGPRGTGKTSTARILAMAANCRAPENGEPDNKCDICVSIREGHALDLIEIDAASNRGIDDIRDLSNKVRFTPAQATYKVYIIDEAHMLTAPAFNALLKTLEEPPGHAIFILATTEVHRLPLTVISRCQRFDFHRIPQGLIEAKLAELCREEDVEASTEALALIARNSSGSLRDAENLLEQVVVSYGSPLTEAHVRDMLGLTGDEVALQLAAHVLKGDIGGGLGLIGEVTSQGSDLAQLQRGIVDVLRGVLLLKTDGGRPEGYPEEATAKMKELADSAQLDRLVHALKTFSNVDMRRDSYSPLPLELALLESSSGPLPPTPPPARTQETSAESGRAAVAPACLANEQTPTTVRVCPAGPSRRGCRAAYGTRTPGRASPCRQRRWPRRPVERDREGAEAHRDPLQAGGAASRMQGARDSRWCSHAEVLLEISCRSPSGRARQPGHTPRGRAGARKSPGGAIPARGLGIGDRQPQHPEERRRPQPAGEDREVKRGPGRGRKGGRRMMNKKMLRQAKQLQQQMMKIQQELEDSTVEATAGGGAVRAVVSGKLRVESLTIDPDAVSPDDVEILQDLVMAATNEGLQKAQDMASSRMGAITGGLNIPGLG